MKIVHVSPYVVDPPDSGGKYRIINLNKFLSEKNEIFQFSCNLFRVNGKIPFKSWANKINKNYSEYCYCNLFLVFYSFIFHKLRLFPMGFLSNLLRIYSPGIVKEKVLSCDIICIEHPWLFDWIAQLNKNNRPIVYSARNIEYLLAKDVFEDIQSSPLKNYLINRIRMMEERCLNKCDFILTVSDMDAQYFIKEYSIPSKKIESIVGGFDTKTISIPSEKEKKELKSKKRFNNKKIILFVGGNYEPNHEAVRFIERLSLEFKEKNIMFLIAGSVADKYASHDNMVYIPERKVKEYQEMADIALNPIFTGVGSNVKLSEYLGYGLPIISTKLGMRGYEINKEVLIAETVEEFKKSIYLLLKTDKLRLKMSKSARKLAEKKYDWSVLSKKVGSIYQTVCWAKKPKTASTAQTISGAQAK